jgi:hypothetical protein
MLLKKVTLAALAGTVLLAAAPAFADGYRSDRHEFRGDRHEFRGGHFERAPVVVHRPAYGYYGYRPVVVQRQPVVVYREHSSHDVLGGLIVGAVLGAVIATHAGY